ncbi:MAG: hypothetical protein ACYSTI_13845, partial [Planctomycetota bacterium]
MGQEKYEDTTKFLDSYNAWTLTPGMWMPAPLARFAKGMRNEVQNTPGTTQLVGDPISGSNNTMTWTSLTGSTNVYFAAQFTALANFSVGEIWIYVKYFGSPPVLNCAIYTDSANRPNSAVASSTLDTTNINLADALPEGRGVGQWLLFNYSTKPSVSVSTDYHVVVWNAQDGSPSDNYWQIGGSGGGDYTGNLSKSTDGSSWSSTGAPQMFYRVTETVADAKMHFVEYKNAVYACSEPLDGTAGKIYLQGDRGVATGTSTANLLKDTTQSWTVDQWQGAYVHIWNGTGQGQYRRIVDNTATDLIVYDAAADAGIGVGQPFEITPVAGSTDTGSEYVIVGTDKWQDVTPTGSAFTITKPITDVHVLWGVMYVCQNEGANVAKLREYNNSGTWDDFHGANAGTNDTAVIADAGFVAQFLDSTYDPVNENFVWRARNEAPAEWTGTDQTSVSKADDVTWASNMTFGNPVPCGTRDHLITQLAVYNGKLWVGKEDSIWYIDFDGSYDRAYPLQIGLEAMSEPDNCRAMVAKDLFLFFNWAHSVERLYGSTLDDIGPWRGTGLPERARGPIVDLVPAIGWMFGAVDAGPFGQSSLIAYNERGWHNLYRAPGRESRAFAGEKKAPRIRGTHWQSISGEYATNYLLFECGGDIMMMQMPRTSLNPSLESNLMISPESYVTSSVHDAGYAELEKHFERANVISPYLNVLHSLYIDYIPNANIRDLTNINSVVYTGWTQTTSSTTQPAFTYDLSQSRKRNIILRTRFQLSGFTNPTSTDNAPFLGAGGAGPYEINAVVLDAFSRTPVKYNWVFPVRLKKYSKTLLGELDHDPETLFNQLNT